MTVPPPRGSRRSAGTPEQRTNPLVSPVVIPTTLRIADSARQMCVYGLGQYKCHGAGTRAGPTRRPHLTLRQESSQLRLARLYRGRRTGTRSRSARDDLGAADGADGRTE